MNNLLIKLVMLIAPWYRRQGIDTEQLQAILKVKLLLDDRRPATFRGVASKTKNSKWGIVFFSVVMGMLFSAMLFAFRNSLLGHTFYFSFILIMLGFTLIIDFSNVLFDPRDNFIILPKPINDKTLLSARLLHIGIYVFKLMLMLCSVALGLMFYVEGLLAGLVFMLELLIVVFAALLLVNMVYMAIFRYVKPQKFKDIIAWLQVALGVGIFSANYLMQGIWHNNFLQTFDLLNKPLVWLLPPVWIASLHECLALHVYTPQLIFQAAMALILPFAGTAFLIQKLSTGFNEKLSGMAGSSADISDLVSPQANIKKFSLMTFFSDCFCTNTLEKSGFKITWMLSSRFREFKVKVYPSFAYVPVYFFWMVLKQGRNANVLERWNHLSETKSYIILPYLSCFVLVNVFQFISYSEKYKASWVYFTAPVHQPGQILAGMFKAVVIKFYLPFYLLIMVFSLSIWGTEVSNDLLFSGLVVVFYGLLMSLFVLKGMPFSQPMQNAKAGGRSLISFLILLVPMAIGFAHFYFATWEKTIWALAMLMLGVLWLCFRYYKQETWEGLEFNE